MAENIVLQGNNDRANTSMNEMAKEIKELFNTYVLCTQSSYCINNTYFRPVIMYLHVIPITNQEMITEMLD